MGNTVVEPLILMVCFGPVETGDVVITGAAVVDAGACGVAPTMGEAVVTVVATVVFVPLLVHPAANASMNTAARLRMTIRYELLFAFMVFYHPFHARLYTDFRHIL
jgi:hypothetical protein